MSIKLILLNYFRLLAKLQLLKNSQATIIGITGSAGKSSTRKAVSLILKSQGKVKDSGSANSETGIPFNILGLKPYNYSIFDWLRLALLAPLQLMFNWEKYDYYIVEMGIDSPNTPKNMAYLLQIVQPHLAIVLNASLVHSETFDYLIKDRHPQRRASKLQTLIAQEKFKLVKSLSSQGVSIVNLDQPEFKTNLKHLKSRLITFGYHRHADLKLYQPKNSLKGFSFKFRYQGKIYQLFLPQPYESAYVYTFASAIALGIALGISIPTSLKALKAYQSPAGRLRLFKGSHQSSIIDSSYNASPSSMLHALQFLNKLGGRGYKLAILGDMRELGKESKTAHQQLAEQIMTYAHEAILFGPLTKAYTLPLLLAKNFPAHHFNQMSQLLNFLDTHPPKRAIILVKASQNTLMLERVVAHLLVDNKDVQQLCRRGKYWDKLRAQLD